MNKMKKAKNKWEWLHSGLSQQSLKQCNKLASCEYLTSVSTHYNKSCFASYNAMDGFEETCQARLDHW